MYIILPFDCRNFHAVLTSIPFGVFLGKMLGTCAANSECCANINQMEIPRWSDFPPLLASPQIVLACPSTSLGAIWPAAFTISINLTSMTKQRNTALRAN